MASTTKKYKCQICDTESQHEVTYIVSGYPICKCGNCGVGRVEVDKFDPYSHYDNGYFTGKYEHSYTDYVGSKEILTKEFENSLKFIRKLGPQTGTLLEVGCAYGLFLEQAKKYYNVHGVEIVKEAAEYCHSHGLFSVKHGTLSKSDLDLIGTIDVAVMLDVIEHIDNVAETVEMIATHLRPGGSFIVTTGDWNSAVARLTGPRWRLMAPPLHLWYFTQNSLEKLGQRFGLEVVSYSHPWKLVPIELIFHQARSMLGISSKISLPKPIKALGLPANLYDAMRIAFRKVK